MTTYFLSRHANADLEEIYVNTHDRWGQKQAEYYVHGLFATFEKIALNPELGRLRPELNRQIRSFVHRRHVIYYIIINENVGIARVLHGSMDVENTGLLDD